MITARGITRDISDSIKSDIRSRRSNGRANTIPTTAVSYDIRAAIRNERRPAPVPQPVYCDPKIMIRNDLILRKAEEKSRASIYLPDIEGKYTVAINDDSIDNPFTLSTDIVRTIRDVTSDANTDYVRARKLFDWFEDNIEYGDTAKVTGYSNGIEVFLNQEGVCGEMAFLYVTMSRSIGMRASYVGVTKDHRGDDVNHACAGVRLEDRLMLVDPAYHAFDIKHKKIMVRTDREIIELYHLWRNSN